MENYIKNYNEKKMEPPNILKLFAMFSLRNRNIVPMSYNSPSYNKPLVNNNKNFYIM